MNEYLIYTTEGYTEAPNDSVTVENCQVLGRVFADNKRDATQKLLKTSTWIEEAGFDMSESAIVQILTEEQHNDLKILLEVVENLKDYIPHENKQDFEDILLKLKTI